MNTLDSNIRDQPSSVIWIIFATVALFIAWAAFFEIDQVVRGQGKIVSKTRTQHIQSIDGGVLTELLVQEGSVVKAGQILARLDQTRFEASTNEVQARVNALKAKITRLKAEVEGTGLSFPKELRDYPDLIRTETVLYQRRLKSLNDEVASHSELFQLARQEKRLVDVLRRTGDVDELEIIRSERALVEAKTKLDARRNQYFEQASQELAKAEDELAQNIQVLVQRNELLSGSSLVALVPGVVKNISVSTIGAVLKAGEELMQVIPSGDTLLIEVKIAPSDIADLTVGLPVTVRFDAYDSSIFGTFEGTITYVSGDTIVEKTARGDENFYIVQVNLPSDDLKTHIGKSIKVIPGMSAQVDVKIGVRTVFNYIMKPIMKVVTQSFGEK
ncbi:MAG: HlyD family efflux transporter periplasmic adaptor subunit [Burkholderiaceae bacterium]